MGRKVEIYLNDGLFNAGVLGFVRVCRLANFNMEFKDNRIIVDSDIFAHFADAYLQGLISYFGDDTVFMEIMNRYRVLLAKDRAEETFSKTYDEFFKYLSEKLNRASYKTAYKMVAETGDSFDFLQKVKEIKSEENYDLKISLNTELIEKMQQYQDIIMLKDIIYTRVSLFWKNISFLDKKKNTEPYIPCFHSSFVQPILEFDPDIVRKKGFHCCQCDQLTTTAEGSGMAWLNDIGIDIKRKTSYFWDHSVDSYLCPICNLIYACLPLGFTMNDNEAIFINFNERAEGLVRVNDTFQSKSKQDNNGLYYEMINTFIAQELAVVGEFEFENVQVVRRNSQGYLLNIFSKEKLKGLKTCENHLKRIAKIYFRYNEQEYPIFVRTVDAVMNGKKLYPLMDVVFRYGLYNKQPIYFLTSLLYIQQAIYHTGGEIMNEKMVYAAMNEGKKLKRMMVSDERNENKVRGLSYALLNCLKVRNVHDFLEIVFRQYVSFKIEFPRILAYALQDDQNGEKNDEVFLDLGYAFLIGLNGSDKDNSTQNKVEEEK